MSRRSLPLRAALVIILAASGLRGADPITTGSLLKDMTDLPALAQFPAPGFTCKQFSSYDRAAKSPTENWFANADFGQFLRVEEKDGRKEYVMMDAAGPGAIVRIWSANPAGTLRIYLDDAATPVIEAKMQELLGGKYAGLPSPIAGERSKGWNLYFPIPYAKHCKVTSDAGKFYYHVNYRTYPEGTAIETFTTAQLTAMEPAIKALAERLGAPGKAAAAPDAQSKEFEVKIEAGQSVSLASLAGPRAISGFKVQWTPTGDRDEPALRSTVIEMVFDGEKTVEAPLGDFFGAAPGINPFASIPLGVSKDGTMECRWVMPFKQAAEVRVRNLGAATVSLKGQISTQPLAWTDSSMHFHAKWKSQFDVSTDPKFDWNYLTAKGKGVFAGVAFFIDNPVKAWWGEGDEKIYVDGETFPSHFGTGTEDYYGYAWCFPGLFTHAYHNQARCDGPGNYGRTSISRFHILDRIPFTKDFKFDMEIWHWKKCNVNLAVIGYWYALPGGTDSFKAIAADDVKLRPVPELPVVKVKGAIEAESMKILQKTGNPRPQEWDGTSDGHQLWWSGGQKPGDTLALGFDVATAGKYKLSAQFLKAVDYGIAQIEVNGVKAGEPIDFFSDKAILTPPMELGTFELKAGQNTISFTITGANPKAKKMYMIGMDYLLLTPAP